MKYAIIIADGAGDLPLPQLNGQTPLQAARTPSMDRLASMGQLLTAKTTPPGFGAGSDVCTMDLLGYDPRVYHTGRAPLEAAAIDMPMNIGDWIFRVNLVTVSPDDAPPPSKPGVMLDHSAGAISDAEARELFDGLMREWNARAPALAAKLTLRHGVSYRSSMIDSSGFHHGAVVTTPPHEVPGEAWRDHLPRAKSVAGKQADPGAIAAADMLCTLIEISRQFLAKHPVNLSRIAAGKRPASMAWPWGQGTKPSLPSFAERFGVRGSMITAVDLLAGIAKLIGFTRLDVPGVTSYHDTDYVAQGKHTCDALDHFDLVVCHVEAPDEASHQGDWQTKVAAIECIDTHVVGPVLAKMLALASGPRGEQWRIMLLPDHYTLVSSRKHDATPVPVAIAGTRIGPQPSMAARTYSESQANASGLHIAEGHELMEHFLYSGGVPRR